jgi:hypothetical protein
MAGSLPTFVATDSMASLHKVKDFNDKESFSPTLSLSSRFSLDDDERPLPPTPRTPYHKDDLSKSRDGADMV